jgi:hypothetical protein
MAVNLGFLDRSPYFLEIAAQLSSRGCVDPVPDPLLLRKSGSAVNRIDAEFQSIAEFRVEITLIYRELQLC